MRSSRSTRRLRHSVSLSTDPLVGYNSRVIASRSVDLPTSHALTLRNSDRCARNTLTTSAWQLAVRHILRSEMRIPLQRRPRFMQSELRNFLNAVAFLKQA